MTGQPQQPELKKGMAHVDISFPQLKKISPDEWKEMQKKIVHPKDGEKLKLPKGLWQKEEP